MTIPVCWLNFNPDAPNRGYWDQALLEDLFVGRLWASPRGLAFESFDAIPAGTEVAVVVVPGRQNAAHVAEVNAAIGSLSGVLLIISGDEEGSFPISGVVHPNMRVWLMTPRPGAKTDYYLGSGYPPGTPDAVRDAHKTLAWSFSGQVTHLRRSACVEALSGREDGVLNRSEGFTLGLPQEEYWQLLASSKVAPCPGGPVTPDSFRLYEALEAGCVPLVDGGSGRGLEPDYWARVFGQDPPFPVVLDWSSASLTIDDILAAWPARAARALAFWVEYKRTLAYRLDDDLLALGVERQTDPRVTVLVPTSPIPSHPSTSILEETVASIRAQLPDSDIIVMADGIRAEQEDRRLDYDEYLHRVARLCAYHWTNVTLHIADTHLHQGLLTRRAMRKVHTPLILFVEHDTPLVGEIDWAGCSKAVSSGRANVIRFHHEASVLSDHRHLMLDGSPQPVCDVPLLRTVQWSQRPHLASAEFYRWLLDTYFGEESRTMIEDLVYGVLDTHWREQGEEGWSVFKLWMYAPPGDMKRSTHTDGRGGEPKYSMLFAYDGDVPTWAPHPGLRA